MPIEVEYKGTKLDYQKWAETVYEQPKVLNNKELEAKNWISRKPKKPGKHHPWR